MKRDIEFSDVRTRLGRRIRELREEQNITQGKFAMMIGMDRTYLVSVEHGNRNIAIDNLTKIAQGFGITLSELFEGVDA